MPFCGLNWISTLDALRTLEVNWTDHMPNVPWHCQRETRISWGNLHNCVIKSKKSAEFNVNKSTLINRRDAVVRQIDFSRLFQVFIGFEGCTHVPYPNESYENEIELTWDLRKHLSYIMYKKVFNRQWNSWQTLIQYRALNFSIQSREGDQAKVSNEKEKKLEWR